MMYERNECCDCASSGYPCLGSSCTLLHVPYWECDMCGEVDLTDEDVHHVDGMDLCDYCYNEYEEGDGEDT